MEEHRKKGSSRRASDRRGEHRRLEHRRKSNIDVDNERRINVDQRKGYQRKENRRSFDPDVQLGAILGPLKSMDVDKGYTYFNLQRYITPHIVSNSAAAKN